MAYGLSSSEKSSPPSVSRDEVLQWLVQGQKPGKDFVLVDLRRNDHKVKPFVLLYRGFVHDILLISSVKGRHHPWIHQSSGRELVSNNSDSL